jgi:hypothetical protein
MSEIKIIDGTYHPKSIEYLNKMFSEECFLWTIKRNELHGVFNYGLNITGTESLVKQKESLFFFTNDLYNTKPNMYYSHGRKGFPVWDMREMNNLFGEFLDILYIRSLLRLRVCMYLKTEEPYFFGYNYDYTTTDDDLSSVYTVTESYENFINNESQSPTPCNDSKVAILCTHNSNGKIDIDGEVIDIKENRLICFPNNLRYSIITQTDVDRQFLVHINFF